MTAKIPAPKNTTRQAQPQKTQREPRQKQSRNAPMGRTAQGAPRTQQQKQFPAQPQAAAAIPQVRTESDLNSFLSVLDHYYQTGALSEESYLEVKGEAFKKLAHLKKQNAFGSQNQLQRQSRQQQQNQAQQKQAAQNPHNKKLYDAAEKAMEAAVRAAGSKLLGLRHDSVSQPTEAAGGADSGTMQGQARQFPQQQFAQNALDNASVSQLHKAKNDAKALLEFIEESFHEGGLSRGDYVAARSQKLRDIAEIDARLSEGFAGGDAFAQESGEGEEDEDARDSESEEAQLDVFGKRGAKAKAMPKAARKREGEGGFDAIAAAEKNFGTVEASAFEGEDDAPGVGGESEDAVESAAGGAGDIPESFPSFAQLVQRNSAGKVPRDFDSNYGQLEQTGGALQGLENESAQRREPEMRPVELELLQALGLKKNRHALDELEASSGGPAPKAYSAKAKAKGGGPDDMAGSFTPESIAAEEKREQEAVKSSQKPDAAGAFLSKLKAFIPGGPQGDGGAQAAPQAQAEEAQTMAVRAGPESQAEDSAIPADSSAGTMKILMEIEKLKVKTDTLAEMRSAIDERLGRIQEGIGEMRSMAFQRESSQKELEGKVEKYLDLVEALEPQKFLREFDKRDKELAVQQMRLEKLEAMGADVARTANSTKTLLESMGSIKNLSNMNREVAEKLAKMDSVVNRSQKISDDIDSAFIELGKKLEEFSVYAGRQEVLVQTVQDLSEMMENTNRKFETYTAKEELEPVFHQLDGLRRSMAEMRATVYMKLEGREVPPRARELLKQKESIGILLQGLEEDFDSRQISAQDYELAKRANLEKLSQIERELANEYEEMVDKRRQEELAATATARNICVDPAVAMQHSHGGAGMRDSLEEVAEVPGQAESLAASEGLPQQAGSMATQTQPKFQAQQPDKPKQGFFEAIFKAIPAVPIDEKMKKQMQKAQGGTTALPSAEDVISTLSKKEEEIAPAKQKRPGRQGAKQAAGIAAQPAQMPQNPPAAKPQPQAMPLAEQTQPPQPAQEPRAATRGTPAGTEGGKPVFDLKKLLEMRLAIQNGRDGARQAQKAQAAPQKASPPTAQTAAKTAKVPAKRPAPKQPPKGKAGGKKR
ncbi:MAG: hypothetical protein WC792_00025 [Candidatus Micrarchaeia archaeon]